MKAIKDTGVYLVCVERGKVKHITTALLSRSWPVFSACNSARNTVARTTPRFHVVESVLRNEKVRIKIMIILTLNHKANTYFSICLNQNTRTAIFRYTFVIIFVTFILVKSSRLQSWLIYQKVKPPSYSTLALDCYYFLDFP